MVYLFNSISGCVLPNPAWSRCTKGVLITALHMQGDDQGLWQWCLSGLITHSDKWTTDIIQSHLWSSKVLWRRTSFTGFHFPVARISCQPMQRSIIVCCLLPLFCYRDCSVAFTTEHGYLLVRVKVPLGSQFDNHGCLDWASCFISISSRLLEMMRARQSPNRCGHCMVLLSLG